MPVRIIDGKPIAERIRHRVSADVAALQSRGIAVRLAAVVVGDDGSSLAYARSQEKACRAVNMAYELIRLPADLTQADAEASLNSLSRDSATTGLLLFLPVPSHLDASRLQACIAPEKDVEGVSPASLGRLVLGRKGHVPCTAAAAMECIRATGIDLAGANAVVVGRSPIVGKPLAALLLAAHATVTQCHSRTANLAEYTRRADVLAVAAGRAGLIGREHVRPGAIVIDVGTNVGPDGRSLVGDVRAEELHDVAGWMTPVPGGVGPVTVAMLLSNVVAASGRGA